MIIVPASTATPSCRSPTSSRRTFGWTVGRSGIRNWCRSVPDPLSARAATWCCSPPSTLLAHICWGPPSLELRSAPPRLGSLRKPLPATLNELTLRWGCAGGRSGGLSG